jgi:hypothetical protein
MQAMGVDHDENRSQEHQGPLTTSTGAVDENDDEDKDREHNNQRMG